MELDQAYVGVGIELSQSVIDKEKNCFHKKKNYQITVLLSEIKEFSA